MKRSRPCRRAEVFVAAVSVVLVLGSPAASRAGVTNSRHDFTKVRNVNGQDLDKGGVCTPCHTPHFAPDDTTHDNPDLGIWARDMSQESGFYEQNGLVNANYVPRETKLCYDCHDDNVSADSEPVNSDFSYPPQDIALGGAAVGYYENACGQLPVGSNAVPTDGSPTGGHYWKSIPSGAPGSGFPDYARGDKIACSLCHDPHNTKTGSNEAFFRTITWDGSTMKPLNDFNSYGTDLKASTYNATTLPNGSRNGTGNGRKMCGICHGYSDQGTQATLNSVTVPIPTPGVAEHAFDDSVGATACVACHGHNLIAGCNACHGYPPMLTEAEGEGTFNPNDPDKPNRKYVENYPGGAGAHRRHRDALAALGATIFECALCHGPNPGRPGTTWHNEGCNTDWATVGGTNVDIMGQVAYWGTSGGPTPPGYNGVTTGGFTGPDSIVYAFAAKGGGAQRCSNLTCHGLPPNAADDDDALNWDDRMVYDTSDATAGNWVAPAGDSPKICKWCHDKSPARIGTGGVWAPNVLGDGDDDGTGSWTASGTWGGDVSGHGKATGNYDADSIGGGGGVAAANKQCTVCHDARYTNLTIPAPPLPYSPNTPISTHFNGSYENSASEKRLRDTINTIATANADATCGACHQNGATGAAEGTEVSTHGNNFDDNKEGAKGSMTRSCRQCHDVHGANWNGAGRNLHLVGKWLDNPLVGTRGAAEVGEEARVDSTAAGATADITSADAKVIFTANSGEDSYDDGFGGPTEDPALHESVCVVCHADLVGNHNEAGSPEVLNEALSHNPVGTDCMICHDHDYDNAVATADGFAPSGCNGCHGNAAVNGQYWPDGLDNNGTSRVLYADDNAGQHQNHVESISRRVFGLTVAQLLLDSTKQKQVCRYCHKNPGGGGHNADSGDSRADVFAATGTGDYFGRYAPGTEPLPPAAPVEDADGLAYTYGAVGEGTCNNLACHNLAATPFWNAVVDWTTPVPPTNCSNTTCHAAATYTNAHATHVGAAGKGYDCTECHTANYNVADLRASLQHQDGDVDMVWTTAGSIEAAHGGNGFYDKNDPTYGDTGFAARSGTYNVTCNLVYCHGGDNAGWGGGDITPVWDNSAPDSVYCGSCHDGNGTASPAGDGSVAATGNHTDHLTATYGPRFADPAGIGPGNAAASCVGTATTGCHPDFLLTTDTHVNGSTEFANIVTTSATLSVLGDTAPAGAPDATSTDRCNSCHSTESFTFNIAGPATVSGAGAALAKTNWASGAYTLPCLTCHNGTAPATVFADGTGTVTAPDMLGDDANYGAEVRGHNRSLAAGDYPVSGNPAAARTCDGATGCHDAASVHINDSADATYAGNRMLGTINGIGATTATGACNACHATGTSPATKKSVNMHGNTSYAGRLEGFFPGASGTPSGMECANCHEPHGRVENGTGYNIYMVPSTILVPGTAAGVTASGVRFEARTGNFSFNDTQGTDTDDLCIVCHGSNGNGMSYNEGGDHAAPGYDNNEQGSDCSGCHTHNRDGNVGTVDGLMTVACNACHTYTPLLTGSVTNSALHRLSPSHDVHIGKPSDETAVANKAFTCSACHYQSSHNNAGRKPGDAWGTVTAAQVQVRFANPSAVPPPPQAAGPWNPVAAANNPADRTLDSTSYVGTVCSNLYCHGASATFPTDDAGTDTTPDWGSAATGDCGTCHGATAAAPPGALAHPKHAGNAALPADPQYSIGCKVCHYATTTDGTTIVTTGPELIMSSHVNHSVEVAFDAAADPRVDGAAYGGDDTVGAGYGACTATYCHSNGTDLAAPYDTAGDAAPAVALSWDAASTCWSCHGDGTTNSMPGYDDGTPKANKHQIHNNASADTPPGNGYGCQVCHWPTTQTGDAIVSTALHVNRSYDANDDGAGSTLDAFDYAPATNSCDNANCHGGNDGISWGLAGTITCDTCHSYVDGARTATDVNNFVWDGAASPTAVQSKIGNAAGGEYETAGHGKVGTPSVACAGCHDSALPHDPSMAGSNPYRLTGFSGDQVGFCNTTCHATASQVRTHDPDQMQDAGIAPKRTPWPSPWNTSSTSPRCVNCHDPHGDGTNLSMVQRELYDKAPFQVNAAAPPAPTDQPNLLFTDDVTGVKTSSPYNSYADNNTFSSVCQECHEATGGATGMVSFHDGPSGGTTFGANHPAVGTADCSDCHRHDAGFAPSGCDGCHNGVQTKYPLAPNVMGNGTLPNGNPSHATPKPYDNGTWGYNVNGHGANGSATNTPKDDYGDAYLSGNAKCEACHNISDPSGTHLDGTLNSVELKQNLNTNTAHLIAEFMTGTSSPAWDVQVNFDDTCYAKTGCHVAAMSHRHAKDSDPAAKATRFGDGGTVLNGQSIRYPIDIHLTTNASTGGRDYAPCISCHNPHGTPVDYETQGKVTNRMLRDLWVVPETLCVECHR